MEVIVQLHASAASVPGKQSPRIRCVGGSIGLGASLDTGVETNLLPLPGIEPRFFGCPDRKPSCYVGLPHSCSLVC
jgi:hypothetical protein